MITLVCLVIGEGNPFPVKLEESELVGVLMQKIKEMQQYPFPGNQLTLFLAKKDGMENGQWLSDEDPDVLELSKLECPDDVRVKYLSDKMKMKPTYRIRRYDFPSDERREDGEIHVLVQLPNNARSTAIMETEVLSNVVETAVNKVLEERDRKRSLYSISTCPYSKEELLMRHLGLEYESFDYTEVLDNSITGYQWSELTEKHSLQRKAYMKYLEEHLHDALFKNKIQKYFVLDTAFKRALLDCNDRSRLPFYVKGTADMMIVDTVAKQYDDIFAGLRMVIEVKKDAIDARNRFQLLLELVSADLKSESKRVPMGLLTDLNMTWYFIWFSEEKKIARYALSSPANAFRLIKEILKEEVSHPDDGYYQFSIPFLDPNFKVKRQKLKNLVPASDDGAGELLERYQLMADELSPEFLLERKIEYFHNLIGQMPIHSHMYS